MIRNVLFALPLVLASTAFAATPAAPAAPATPAATPAAPAKAPATTPSTTTATTPATTTPAAANPTFVSLDKNKDAGLDKTEISAVAPVVAAFATLDADKNGKLSEVEYKAWSDKNITTTTTTTTTTSPATPAATPATPAAPPVKK